MTRLYPGDCLRQMDHVQTGSVDLILCDLPYGTTQCTWDCPIPFAPLWDQYLRVSKPRAAIVLTAQTPFDKVLGSSRLDLLRYEWVWEKTAATGHLNAKRMPLKAHENILVFYRKHPVYVPQKTKGHVRKTATARRNADGSPVYGVQRGTTSYDSTERYPRSVLVFPADKQRIALHPTQKPVALMEYLIRTYTMPGATVMDNCMGSGTTGVACVNTRRKFIGIELDDNYFEIARRRIAEAQESLYRRSA